MLCNIPNINFQTEPNNLLKKSFNSALSANDEWISIRIQDSKQGFTTMTPLTSKITCKQPTSKGGDFPIWTVGDF